MDSMETVHAVEPRALLSDAEVVERVRNGDREVYRVLVQRYQDTLYRYALSMTRQGDVASDLVQSAFVKAYSQIGRLRDPSNFGGWVYRMAVNGCKDWLKNKRRKDVRLDDGPPLAVPQTATPEADLERAELRRALEDALGRLGEEQREAFVLKHVEGRSYEEIAELLEVSVPALKMRVHRAREALRGALEEVL